jgi:hypothetical protein
MATDQAVGEILDQTIQALAFLDLNKLQILEQRIAAVAESNVVFNQDAIASLQAKKRTLELVLQSCESNLDTLRRLHKRNVRDQWAH